MKDFAVNVRLEKVISYLKFSKKFSSLETKIETLILKEIEEFYRYVKTCGIYKIQEKFESKSLFLESKNIETLLHNSEKVLIFAVSLGEKIDEKIEEFLTENILKASIWDAIASEAAEQAANYLNNYLANKLILKDLITTTRYSPGYGDWPLKANFEIFKLLGLENFEISINEAGLLIPQKTITAIIGLKSRV